MLAASKKFHTIDMFQLKFTYILLLPPLLDIEYNKKARTNIAQAENENLLNKFINELSHELKNIFNIIID